MSLDEIHSLVEVWGDITVLVVDCCNVQIVRNHTFRVIEHIAFGTAQYSFDLKP